MNSVKHVRGGGEQGERNTNSRRKMFVIKIAFVFFYLQLKTITIQVFKKNTKNIYLLINDYQIQAGKTINQKLCGKKNNCNSGNYLY